MAPRDRSLDLDDVLCIRKSALPACGQGGRYQFCATALIETRDAAFIATISGLMVTPGRTR